MLNVLKVHVFSGPSSQTDSRGDVAVFLQSFKKASTKWCSRGVI